MQDYGVVSAAVLTMHSHYLMSLARTRKQRCSLPLALLRTFIAIKTPSSFPVVYKLSTSESGM